jgi:hypothetical protein
MVLKTSTLTLREEHEVWEFEIWLLSNIFGYEKRQQEECGINENLYDLHVWTNITLIRVMKLWRMRYATQVTLMNEKRNVYRVLMGKPEVQKPLENSRSKLEDNIKSEFKTGLR